MDRPFEALEDRTMMAVSVSQSGTQLFILGDAADDSIEVFSSGSRLVILSGGVRTDVTGTTLRAVNEIIIGLDSGNDTAYLRDLALPSNVSRISFFGGAGDDQLSLGNTSQPALDVRVDGSLGNDTLSVGNTFLNTLTNADSYGNNSAYLSNIAFVDRFNFNLNSPAADVGSGNDYVWISGITMEGSGGNSTISTGRGNDQIYVTDWLSRTVNAGLNLNGGDGNDTMYLNRFVVNFSGAALNIQGGGGADSFGIINSNLESTTINFNGGAGDDVFSLSTSFVGGVDFAASLGNDEHYLYSSTVVNSVSADTNQGPYFNFAQRFWMVGVTVQQGAVDFNLGTQRNDVYLDGNLLFNGGSIITGDADDTVTVVNNSIAGLSWAVSLGDGNDAMTTRDNRFNISSSYTLDGGTQLGGQDTLTILRDAYRPATRQPVITNFETIQPAM